MTHFRFRDTDLQGREVEAEEIGRVERRSNGSDEVILCIFCCWCMRVVRTEMEEGGNNEENGQAGNLGQTGWGRWGTAEREV